MEVHPPHRSALPGPATASTVAPAVRVAAEKQWQLRLPADPDSPAIARNLVADACLAWQLAGLLHPGRAVVSELVANAVEHAGTDIDLTVSLRGPGLHLAVRDGSPAPPRLLDLAAPVPGRPLDERGQGLRVVEADSIAWGSVPAVDGKVVWATIQARDSYSRRW
jgi:anti-sigma regulatory factor (Ser/Thr protein kinase)